MLFHEIFEDVEFLSDLLDGFPLPSVHHQNLSLHLIESFEQILFLFLVLLLLLSHFSHPLIVLLFETLVILHRSKTVVPSEVAREIQTFAVCLRPVDIAVHLEIRSNISQVLLCGARRFCVKQREMVESDM